MPIHIVPTYRCNQECIYCITKNYISYFPNEMSLVDLEFVLDWLNRQKIRSISLAGGEPTFYSNFKEMIALFEKYNIKITLLTNALFNAEITDDLKSPMISSCTINLNPKEYYSKDQFERLDRNIKIISESVKEVQISYNISKTNLDYKYYIKTCKTFNIKKIRFSLTAPNKEKNNEYIGINDLKSFVPFIMQFVKEAKNDKLELICDHPLPYCIFNNVQRDFLKKKAELHGKCSAGIDFITINPDMSVYACSPSMVKGPKLNSFATLNQVYDYFRKDIEGLRWSTFLFPQCKTCLYKIRKECQGGCLCYKEYS